MQKSFRFYLFFHLNVKISVDSGSRLDESKKILYNYYIFLYKKEFCL